LKFKNKIFVFFGGNIKNLIDSWWKKKLVDWDGKNRRWILWKFD
jgi:hypothetical protein